jgi:hypothetical protein
MRTTISVEGNDIKVTLSPDTEIEKLVIQELSDNVGVSRSHQTLVLKRRVSHVRTIDDADFQISESV